jgi:hypothetical protein
MQFLKAVITAAVISKPVTAIICLWIVFSYIDIQKKDTMWLEIPVKKTNLAAAD